MNALTPTTQAAFGRIERAFKAALMRLEAAQSFPDAEDEVSNLLHHLYRLFELARRQAGVDKSSLSVETRVMLKLRGADTHAVVKVAQGARRYPEAYPLCFNIPVFELGDGAGIDDPAVKHEFQVSVRGKAADKLLPEAFEEVRSTAGLSSE